MQIDIICILVAIVITLNEGNYLKRQVQIVYLVKVSCKAITVVIINFKLKLFHELLFCLMVPKDLIPPLPEIGSGPS